MADPRSLLDAVQAPARQNAALEATDHRPWPLPEGTWIMGQTWEDLLFAHWRAPARELRELLPDGLELDLYEDEAWVGVGDVLHADPRSLAHFLTERYCLYTGDAGRLRRIQIHHGLWPLQPAEATMEENTMAPRGLELVGEKPLLHFSARQDALFWPFEDA